MVKMGTTANQKKMFFNLRKAKSKISVLDEGDMRPVSLSETPYSWRTGANRVMLLPDGPTAQIALRCAHWTVPVQRAA